MGNKNISLLCTGDLHLGRHPTKIPEDYDSRQFSPVSIWEKIVQKTITLDCDALLITGDIIDRDNCYFEAFGTFEAGLKKLEEADIMVYAVAGNHDYSVLPDLVRNLHTANFFLLGAEGNWECRQLQKNGEPILNLVGWSYPERRVRRNPLSDFTMPESDLPAVGLIHAESDNPGSNYAPVSVEELQATDINGWVLGHIHKGSLIAEKPTFILNPGTPQPLSPGEPGLHCVWELIIKPEGSPVIREHALASLKYINIKINVSKLKSFEGLPGRISAALAQEIEDGVGTTMHISSTFELIIARIILTGRTELNREFEAKNEMFKELELKVADCPVIIEKIVNQTQPPIDVEELAQGNNQLALLADYILKLKTGKDDELPESLLQNVEDKLFTAYSSSAYQPLRRENYIQPPTEEDIYSILEKQARLLLESLLAQKEE